MDPAPATTDAVTNQPPQEAVEYLKSNPNTWSQFKDTFGVLPEGFKPPAAPKEAVDYYTAHPESKDQFQDTFGYLPDAPAQNDPNSGSVKQPVVPGQKSPVPSQGAPHGMGAIVAGATSAYQQNGIAGIRDYFLKKDPKEISQALSGAPAPARFMGNADLLVAKNLAAMGAGIVKLPEMAWDYLGENEPADIKAERARNLVQNGPQFGDKLGTAVRGAIDNTADAFHQGEDAFARALSPEAQAGIQKHFINRTGTFSFKLGDAVKDPYWWTDAAASLAPMIITDGASGVAAKAAYGSKFTQVLAKAAAEQAPTSVAVKAAQREALSAAHRAAVLTSVGANGVVFGGQAADDVQRSIGQLDEATMMNYAPYRALRMGMPVDSPEVQNEAGARREILYGSADGGLSHEAARAQIANDRGLMSGLAVAITAGLGGEPLNRFMSKWVSKIPAGTSRATGAAFGAAGAAAQGGAIGASTQLAQNLALSPINGQDTWDGVLEATLKNALVGGAMGGVGGAAAGGKGKPSPTAPTDRVIQQKLQTFANARENLQAAYQAAADPHQPMTKDQLDEAHTDYQTSLVDLHQELLASGKLKPADQQAVAAALAEAKQHGVEIPEREYDHNESGTLPGAASEPGQGDTNKVSGPSAATPGATENQAAADAASPNARTGSLSGIETSKLDVLNRIANAEPASSEEVHGLVAEGSVKIMPTGKPVLLPAGRRMRDTLNGKIESANDAQAAATAAAKEPVAKPSAKPVVVNEPTPTLQTMESESGPLEPEPAAKEDNGLKPLGEGPLPAEEGRSCAQPER